jgi:hypothetical protein
MDINFNNFELLKIELSLNNKIILIKGNKKHKKHKPTEKNKMMNIN